MARIDVLFDEARALGASDLHLAPGQAPLARVHGPLLPLREGVLEAKEVEELALEILPPSLRTRLSTELEVVFALPQKDSARVRASYFVKNGGLGASFRFVPVRAASLAELECPEILWRLLDRKSGILLVAGGGGSGRTTTAAAMVDHLNKTRACHILTLDEPLEYVHEPGRAQITQREIGPHASSLPVAMRNATREDVDVVMIGDLRIGEPMKLALDLAASGILVVAVVHASGAISAVEQMLASFPPDERVRGLAAVADSLVGVVAQQLLRTGDSKARVPVHEVLVTSAAVASAIREGKPRDLGRLMAAGHAQGMATFEAALERLLVANRIPPDVAYQRALDKEAFTHVLARVRPDLVEHT